MGLLPREHGAYGQITFPLIAAFAAAGVSTPGILIALAAGGGVLLALLVLRDVLPPATLVAAAPGLVTSAALALRPPAPAQLRRVGWTLVAVSVLTTVLVVSSA